MDNHTHIAEENDPKENDWRSEVQLSDDFIAYRGQCLSMLSKFQHMWDGHVGQIKAETHQVEQFSPDKRSIHSAQYRDSPC